MILRPKTTIKPRIKKRDNIKKNPNTNILFKYLKKNALKEKLNGVPSIFIEIIRLKKDIQEKRFENINKYRQKMIEAVKQRREEIIEEQEEKKVFKSNTNINNNNKKTEILNLEKMLEDIRSKEEKNIEKIKQKQKNEIIGEITRNLKSKIILNKNNLKEQKVQILHALIKQKMQKKRKT